MIDTIPVDDEVRRLTDSEVRPMDSSGITSSMNMINIDVEIRYTVDSPRFHIHSQRHGEITGWTG